MSVPCAWWNSPGNTNPHGVLAKMAGQVTAGAVLIGDRLIASTGQHSGARLPLYFGSTILEARWVEPRRDDRDEGLIAEYRDSVSAEDLRALTALTETLEVPADVQAAELGEDNPRYRIW